jgi:hypothetical protein
VCAEGGVDGGEGLERDGIGDEDLVVAAGGEDDAECGFGA